jgi:hypothetical protein
MSEVGHEYTGTMRLTQADPPVVEIVVQDRLGYEREVVEVDRCVAARTEASANPHRR